MNSNKLARVVYWGLPALATLMLVLTLIPAGAWRAPSQDQIYSGFDPRLTIVAASGPGGSADVSPEKVSLNPQSASVAVNLATTQMSKLIATFDVEVVSDRQADDPFRVGVWSPWAASGVFLVFGPDPLDQLRAETVDRGRVSITLLGGDSLKSSVIGQYRPGNVYHITASIDRSAGVISVAVSGGDGTAGEATATAADLPTLFTNVQLSVTGSSGADLGAADVVLRNYSLRLPHQAEWAARVADPVATTSVVLLALIGVLALAIAMVLRIRGLRWSPPRLPRRGYSLVLLVGAVVVYIVGNALLFPLGGHPFDMGGARLWAYVLSEYGPSQLYYLPNLISLTWIWHGSPYIQSAFPYEPVTAYLSASIGWLNRILGGDWSFGPGNDLLEYIVKAFNVLFGLGDAIVIYAIMGRLGAAHRMALVAAGLFLFNPAVWFSTSVWGQTHVFSLFFVLLAIYFAETHRPSLAWTASAMGCLTRPQILVFGLVLGLVFIRRFGWNETVRGASWAVIASFVLVSPFALVTSPSLPVDVLLQNLRVQEAGGNVATLTTVSQDGLSIWPLVTYFSAGASGLQRAFTSSSATLFDGVTYQFVGQILAVSALTVISFIVMTRRKSTLDGGGYIPITALAITTFLMLLTGILATHFLLALPLLLMSYRWLGGVAYVYVVAIWTMTTFVPMYGDMGVLTSSLDFPLFSPQHNPITKFFVDLYISDRFISVGVAANVAVVAWLAYAIRRPQDVRPVLAATA